MLAYVVSFLSAAAGWYYLFYSREGSVLGGIENQRINHRRMQLRRVGGGAMLLLGICFYGLWTELERPGRGFQYLTLAVLALLLVIVALALLDLRLTLKLRRTRPRA
jgi:UDP-N-acetylmuramyl pentapeptide phosphotransferase/UDP-N-acetylglucosamine-1-phosphate transferase